ncbi:MAG: hypothetical protein K9I97_05655 [Cryomorphaceae bacterium]|jgi:hypothetical protein|nr:hypothetical protein [Cryomorphaceae bacterium]
MKKTRLFNVAGLLGIALLVGSCGKYPEGPNFAMSSKAARLEGDWKATSVNQSGTEWNLSNLTLTNSISKDGTFTASTVITVFGVPTTYTSAGTWEFYDKKTKLILTETNPATNSKDTMEILMLKKDMVKLKQFDYDSGDTFTYTYEPK